MFVTFVTFVTYYKRHHQVLVEDPVKSTIQFNIQLSFVVYFFYKKNNAVNQKIRPCGLKIVI